MSIEKKLAKLKGKKVALLGLGVENEALLRLLLKMKIPAEFTVCDFRTPEQLGARYAGLRKFKQVHWQLEQDFNRYLSEFDLLLRSPGWTVRCPGIREARRRKPEIEVSSALNLFLEACPTKNVIGVTGTKGKGTTASLITAMLKAGGRRVFLGGNIGVAPFSFIEKLGPDDWVVLELSSFQLEDLRHSPRLAVMTNFSREHLAPADPNNPNYHRTLGEYWQAKTRIFTGPENKVLIANEKLAARIAQFEAKAGLGRGKRHVYTGKSDLSTPLPGEHNLENIALAEAAAKLAGVAPAAIARAVRNFRGLEHRIELVRELGGLAFYDDSFATTPEATITALRAFERPIVALMGGADKGADFRKLALVAKQRTGFIVLLKGVATPRLKAALLAAGYDRRRLAEAEDINTAVRLAVDHAEPGGLVLLSTACASFGMFRNYKERGQLFQAAVKSL